MWIFSIFRIGWGSCLMVQVAILMNYFSGHSDCMANSGTSLFCSQVSMRNLHPSSFFFFFLFSLELWPSQWSNDSSHTLLFRGSRKERKKKTIVRAITEYFCVWGKDSQLVSDRAGVWTQSSHQSRPLLTLSCAASSAQKQRFPFTAWQALISSKNNAKVISSKQN